MLEHVNESHRRVAQLMIDSKMLVRVEPVSKINASGVTGLIDNGDTNDRIEDERLSVDEAFDEIYIAIAEETIDRLVIGVCYQEGEWCDERAGADAGNAIEHRKGVRA